MKPRTKIQLVTQWTLPSAGAMHKTSILCISQLLRSLSTRRLLILIASNVVNSVLSLSPAHRPTKSRFPSTSLHLTARYPLPSRERVTQEARVW